ncbi:uncharacterized protein LOC111568135 [Amphiprion ocellaris]|uniref:uncharacterized protein LOC111568135 n=1 Tax=Amphiprion ocellaris TaxID=80972 RepID=UPI000C317EB7|nr:uncharacterized protein LOC111568135 [Amphiprion ocellaris]
MSWKNQLLYFAVMATLTSFRLCNGQAEGVVERPTLQGTLGFSSLVSGETKHKSPTRDGSLVFRLDQQSGLNSTQVMHKLMDAKLKRMDPSVQCSNNLMTLKVRRVRDARFLVDSGERPLTPLSQMPLKCGFSVKRTRRNVQFAASYQGCHVTKKDGDYVLPLRLWGTPMAMSCPDVLPSPSVFCFVSGMVVKIGGVKVDDLKVKISGTWKSLSQVCSSCGLDFKEYPGGLTLTIPYNRGLCIEFKDEEYLLSLLWLDVEILVTCPFFPDVNPAIETAAPPGDSGQVLQHPQYPQFPLFPQYLLPTRSPAPTVGTVTLLPHPQLYSGAPADYNDENQEAAAAQHPAFPYMPQFLQYLFLPEPEPPTQSFANENTADPLAQLPLMQQSPQYQIPRFPQFPMASEIFHPTTPAPPPTPRKEALVAVPAAEDEGNPQVPQQEKFPVPPQYTFLSFPNRPLSPNDRSEAIEDPKHVVHLPKPQHEYPQSYQIPVLYPPKYLPQRQNTQTAYPTTIPTTSTAVSQKPAAQEPFYHTHPYIPVYFVPRQADMPVFPGPPTTPPDSPAPSDQHERQPAYSHASFPFPFPQGAKTS